MSDNPYTIQLTKQDRKKFEEIAQANGFNTLSKFFRQAAYYATKHPEVFDPTLSVGEVAEPLTETKDFFKDLIMRAFSALDERLATIEERLEATERFQTWTMKKMGAQRYELTKIHEGEADMGVFDE